MKWIFILTCFVFLCCSNQGNKYFLVTKAPSKHYMDTAYFVPTTTSRGDSLILYRVFKHHYIDTFILNLGNLDKVYYSGEPLDKVAYNVNGKIIKSADSTTFGYISDTTIKYYGENYLIIKYRYDVWGANDATQYIYCCPKIGIIYQSSLAWDIDSRLYTSNKSIDSCIGELIGIIHNW